MGDKGTAPELVGSVAITSSSTTLQYGQSVQLVASVASASGKPLTAHAVTWTSSNENLATVSPTGQVTAGAVRGGTTETVTITATTQGKSASTSISVFPIPVASVTPSLTQLSIYVGQTVQLGVTLKDVTGGTLTGRSISWTSATPLVATITAQGLVTAVAPGTASIVATAEGKTTTATVTVALVPVQTVSITPASGRIYTGQTLQLSASAKDSAGNTLTGRTVLWSSGAPSVAAISAQGLLTALAPGMTIITATIGGQAAMTPVAVMYDSLTNISVLPSAETLILGLKKGQSKPLRANYAVKSGQTNVFKYISWTSSDSAVVSVSSSGTITAKKSGTVTVTASAEGKTGSATVQSGDTFDTPVPEFLSRTNDAARQIIPVLKIRFIPTDDGVMLDSTRAPNFYSFDSRSIEQIVREIDSLDIKKKYALEEGSRFRGYGDATAVPAVTFKVVKLFTLYKNPPISAVYKYSDGAGRIDYTKLFSELGIIPLINSMKIKEVWLDVASWGTGFPVYKNNTSAQGIFDLSSRYGTPESAMSSPRGECISNSYQEDCLVLPKANHTFLVYGDYYRRGWSCAVHNRGHQFEVMFRARDRDALFDRRFVGVGLDGKMGTGRSGMTHFPPNTNTDYDYWNTKLVPSDIETWIPSGGATKMVNNNTWDLLPYRYPDQDNCGGRWLTYWMQAFPNANSNIALDGRQLENWWDLYANWDTWVSERRSLVKGSLFPALQGNNLQVLTDPRQVKMAFTDYPAPQSRRPPS
jgi:uncharacterized protein YjdB